MVNGVRWVDGLSKAEQTTSFVNIERNRFRVFFCAAGFGCLLVLDGFLRAEARARATLKAKFSHKFIVLWLQSEMYNLQQVWSFSFPNSGQDRIFEAKKVFFNIHPTDINVKR